MAADLLNPTLSESKFLNWIKAALAVLFTKEEIEPVVYDEIVQFQQKCLQDIVASKCLPPGSTCSYCSTENVIVCPTNRICNAQRGHCSYHRNVATHYRPSGCPNNICHHLKSEIQNAHRYDGPSFKNTDAKQWCSNPWEIAKCYMPPDGYKDVTNAAETDFNGINSVIINHKGFDVKIQDDLSKKNNIFYQGREVGKAVRHSPNLEVEDADLTKYFTILNNILTDPGFIAINKSPHNAIQKLTQLQNDELVIGKDVVRQVLNDAGKAIQEQIKDEISVYKQVTEEQKKELLDIVEEKVKKIEIQGNVSIAELNDVLKSSVDDFKALVQKSFQDIKKQIREGQQTLKDSATKLAQEFNNEKEKALEELQRKKESGGYSTGVLTEEMYQQRKQELKKQLVKFYKSKRSTVPLSPLVEEKVTPLAGFYVMPNMVMVKQTSHTSHKEERTPIDSLKDLFIIGSEDQQEIYLSADAGFGKTSFSKYLTITWSQACCPDNNQNCFKPEELKALANFEFVFLVLLRDSTAVCYIDEMIEQQIIKKLPPPASQCPLHEVLDREKCLIILDGLDEWTHPDNDCTDKKEKIPHRYSRDNCVILTTTRPWKLGVSNHTTSDINKKVELVQLSKDSTRQLEKNAIRKMSGVNDDGELMIKTREFDKVIASRGLQHMQTIPLLLMYITCLWCNKIPIGNSKVEVYINIIEFLLSRTAQKHPEVLPSSEPSHSDIPEYFKKYNFCKKFYSLLTALAELAYHTLFNEKRENTLVFDGSVAGNYHKADDMKLSLLSGILTRSTTTTLIERKSKVSFSHKTVQELFAAIFISSQSDAQKTVVEKCKNVQSILDMSTICEFVSKMNSKMMCEISDGLMSVINEDEKTRKYRTMTVDVFMYVEPLYNIQKMLVPCLQEMTGSENIKLCLQDFFINGDTIHDKHLQRLLKLNTTNMKSLHYAGIGVYDEDLSLFLSPSLQTLRVSGAIWRNYDGNLCDKIDTLKNVQYLYISHLKLSHEILEIFYNFICGNKTIKQLTLIRLYCIEHDHDCKMMLNLSKHSQLKNVHLWRINHLDESSLLLPRDMLNIECVELVDIEISGECLQNMVKNMETISHLVTVKMYDIKPETEYERFRNYIRSSQTFDLTCDDGGWFEFQTRKPSKE